MQKVYSKLPYGMWCRLLQQSNQLRYKGLSKRRSRTAVKLWWRLETEAAVKLWWRRKSRRLKQLWWNRLLLWNRRIGPMKAVKTGSEEIGIRCEDWRQRRADDGGGLAEDGDDERWTIAGDLPEIDLGSELGRGRELRRGRAKKSEEWRRKGVAEEWYGRLYPFHLKFKP